MSLENNYAHCKSKINTVRKMQKPFAFKRSCRFTYHAIDYESVYIESCCKLFLNNIISAM